jgi:hypothetical protein
VVPDICEESEAAFRSLMGDYGVSFRGLIDALGLELGRQDLTDPDLSVSLRPWIRQARELDARRRQRPRS